MSEVTERKQETQPQSREASSDSTRTEAVRPAADIFEHSNGITLLLDMPGVSRERLHIHTDQNQLTVEGSVEIDMPQQMQSLYADVRSTHYRRTFSLSGEQLDTEAAQASLKDGVLRIDIPKREELRPRRIEVKTS